MLAIGTRVTITAGALCGETGTVVAPFLSGTYTIKLEDWFGYSVVSVRTLRVI